MDSHQQTCARFPSPLVESPRSVNSQTDSRNGSNPENIRGNGKRSYSAGEDVREEGQGEGGFVGVLDVYVHHARDVHNICIYDKQDVYAKLSLTSNPDEAFSTRIVPGAGRNPIFNEGLQLNINGQLDVSLKCEVWMLSRARNYMEDQLLGFALVPLGTVVGKGKVSKDFELSSTELFHSPAGIVQLTISYHGSVPADFHIQPIEDANMALSPSLMNSEGVFVGPGMENTEHTNYNDIEFPDLQVASENHQLVSEFIKMASGDLKPENSSKRDLMIADPDEKDFSGSSLLHLGAVPLAEDDYEMATIPEEERCLESPTAVAKDTNSSDYQPHPVAEDSSPDVASSATSSSKENQCPNNIVAASSPESIKLNGVENSSNGANDNVSSMKEEKSSSKESDKEGAACSSQSNVSKGESGISLTTPLISINLEPEQTVVQQQIVDMYMQSMQQFTESLAKMKLPMDIESQGSGDSTKSESEQKNTQSGKNAGSRVFYGSRAFF